MIADDAGLSQPYKAQPRVFSPSTPPASTPNLLHIRTSIMTSLFTALPNIPSLRRQQLYLEL